MISAAPFRPASVSASALPPTVWLFVLGACVLPGLACGGRGSGPPADLVLLDGAVLTLDPDRPQAEAVAVRSGLIAAVGSNREVLTLAGPATRRIDLHGRMVLPGLVDAHAHVRSLGERLSTLDLHGVGSPDEVARRVRERAAALPPGAWLRGGGWDQNLWPGKAFPDHRPLSAAVPDRPVVLDRVDGHAAWANLAAMRAASVTRATRDPAGGLIVRDARGEPTGVFIDNAVALLREAEPDPQPAEIKATLRRALERCAEVGLTGVHDASIGPEVAAAYRELADAGEMPVRVYAMLDGTGIGTGTDGGGTPVEPLLRQPPLVDYRDRLTIRALKLMVDGAMGSRGAVFFDDYDDDPGNRGLYVSSPAAIEAATEAALRAGYQVCTHAIGDRGISDVLDAYEKALAAVPSPDPRLRIEHLQCVRPADVARVRRLGIIASMQPSHATSDMPWAEDRVGAERGRGLYAWRWVLEAGVPIAAGSDFPVDPENPLVGIHAAVTRQDLENRPPGGWHPDQRMTLLEAIRAYTTSAARAAFEEDQRGRIAPGLWADLTVLSEDLRAIPAERIAEVRVTHTLVGGTPVYERP